ncbi:hypothetical protein HK102_005538 [Quaeritorhiza haematococci]|nr:hypothetical protein HK102_005538 [Quaeritorhiza haematococci]
MSGALPIIRTHASTQTIEHYGSSDTNSANPLQGDIDGRLASANIAVVETVAEEAKAPLKQEVGSPTHVTDHEGHDVVVGEDAEITEDEGDASESSQSAPLSLLLSRQKKKYQTMIARARSADRRKQDQISKLHAEVQLLREVVRQVAPSFGFELNEDELKMAVKAVVKESQGGRGAGAKGVVAAGAEAGGVSAEVNISVSERQRHRQPSNRKKPLQEGPHHEPKQHSIQIQAEVTGVKMRTSASTHSLPEKVRRNRVEIVRPSSARETSAHNHSIMKSTEGNGVAQPLQVADALRSPRPPSTPRTGDGQSARAPRIAKPQNHSQKVQTDPPPYHHHRHKSGARTIEVFHATQSELVDEINRLTLPQINQPALSNNTRKVARRTYEMVDTFQKLPPIPQSYSADHTSEIKGSHLPAIIDTSDGEEDQPYGNHLLQGSSRRQRTKSALMEALLRPHAPIPIHASNAHQNHHHHLDERKVSRSPSPAREEVRMASTSIGSSGNAPWQKRLQGAKGVRERNRRDSHDR